MTTNSPRLSIPQLVGVMLLLLGLLLLVFLVARVIAYVEVWIRQQLGLLRDCTIGHFAYMNLRWGLILLTLCFLPGYLQERASYHEASATFAANHGHYPDPQAHHDRHCALHADATDPEWQCRDCGHTPGRDHRTAAGELRLRLDNLMGPATLQLLLAGGTALLMIRRRAVVRALNRKTSVDTSTGEIEAFMATGAFPPSLIRLGIRALRFTAIAVGTFVLMLAGLLLLTM